MTRIDWVAGSCRLLNAVAEEYDHTQPFAGAAIRLEPKTVALLLTLQRGGAEVVATGNVNSTQPEAVAHLRERGVQVVGERTVDADEHDRHLREVLAAEPALLLDNGGGLFARWLEAPYPGLRGGTEETTSGRIRLAPLREQIGRPVLVINDSPIKQFAENTHAVGQSVLEAFMRITNRVTNGRRVTVFGYGACGRGVAGNFRAAHARVSVVDIDPVARLRALFDGYAAPERAAALADADVVLTVTGARDVVGPADLALLRDGGVLANAGHVPWEIDVAGLRADPAVAEAAEVAEAITTLRLRDGRAIHVLGAGQMVNLAGPRPLGNSIESMDLGFTLQARCLEAVASGAAGAGACVVPVPAAIDAAVASAYLAL